MIARGVIAGFLAAAVGSLIPAYSSQPAGAAVVDQYFTNGSASGSAATSLTGDTWLAQSFTVGVGGLLTGADLLAFDATSEYGSGAPPLSDMIVQIRGFSTGLPTDTVLASYTVPASNLLADPHGQYTHVDFSTGVPVAPGEVLGLAINGVGVGWYLQWGAAATYNDGQGFVRPHEGFAWMPLVDNGNRPSDFLFRTYVDVPEPSIFPLTVCVASLLLLSPRFRGAGAPHVLD